MGVNVMGDQTLAEQAAAGSREAFALLLERHYDQIYRLAWRLCGSRAAAEDVAQDVCVKLAAAIRGFRGESAFSTWVWRITFTTATDRLRAAQRTTMLEPSQIMALVDATESGGPTPEDAAAGAELWAAVRELPPQQRDAVLLVYGEDMSHAEAAGIMGCSEKTVSWHIHEAKKRLKSRLQAAG
jgi:RNA polymerase sigma-70 factor (ECF subfamily)